MSELTGRVSAPAYVKVVKKPEAEKAAEGETKPSIWDEFVGQRIVLQTKQHNVIIGTFINKAHGIVRLENAKICGTGNIATVPVVLVDPYSIAHFHPEGEVEKRVRPEKYKPKAEFATP